MSVLLVELLGFHLWEKTILEVVLFSVNEKHVCPEEELKGQSKVSYVFTKFYPICMNIKKFLNSEVFPSHFLKSFGIYKMNQMLCICCHIYHQLFESLVLLPPSSSLIQAWNSYLNSLCQLCPIHPF